MRFSDDSHLRILYSKFKHWPRVSTIARVYLFIKYFVVKLARKGLGYRVRWLQFSCIFMQKRLFAYEAILFVDFPFIRR